MKKVISVLKWILGSVLILVIAYLCFTSEYYSVNEIEKYTRTVEEGSVTYLIIPKSDLLMHVKDVNGVTIMLQEAKIVAELKPVDGYGSLYNRLAGIYSVDILDYDNGRKVPLIEENLPLSFTDSGLIIDGAKFKKEIVTQEDKELVEDFFTPSNF